MKQEYDIYTAVALQNEIKVIEERSDLQKNLDRVLKLIDYAPQSQIAARGRYEGSWAPIKLISAAEFFIQGHDGGWTYEHYMKNVVVDLPGPETEQIAKKCKEYGIYFAGCVLERDHEFDMGIIWNTQFIIDPRGEIIHKYRKFTNAIHFELNISPHDIKDKYAEKYGGDKLSTWFPVTETEIGKIGVITCMDGHFPENARALGIQGAEIILHPLFASPLMAKPLDIWQTLNRARAWENICYVIGASWGDIHGNRQRTFAPGQAMIVDYNGVVQALADYPGEGMVTATINLEELRRRRLDPSRNFPTQLPTDTYRLIYEKEIYPPNLFLDRVPTTRKERESVNVIKKWVDEGIYVLPEKLPGRFK
jgi:predicted amidohydrolase